MNNSMFVSDCKINNRFICIYIITGEAGNNDVKYSTTLIKSRTSTRINQTEHIIEINYISKHYISKLYT